MRNYFLKTIILTCLHFNSFSQNGIINGIVTDDTSKEIEFANLKLMRLPDSAMVSLQLSGPNGEFKFKHLKKGTYLISSTLDSYEKMFTSEIQIVSNDSIFVNIPMKLKTIQGQEVTISAQKPLVRFEDGKMIVNVENMLSNSGQSAIEVLQKSPNVYIDQNGSIQLKGKSGVQVMIDDKVMYMTGDQLANLLKSISADQIKEIELTSTPSAKHDASGSAGIINIKLKSGAYEGWNGSFNCSIGKGEFRKSSIGTTITYKKKKLFFNAGIQHQNSVNLSENFNDRRDSDTKAINKRIYNTEKYKMPFTNSRINLKGEYTLNKKTSFTFDLNESAGKYNWKGKAYSTQYAQDNRARSSFIKNDDGFTEWYNIYTSLGFKHKLDSNGTVLDGYGAYNKSFGFMRKFLQLNSYDSLGNNTDNPFIFDNSLDYNSNSYNAQIDFKKKVNKKLKVETGIKAIHSSNDNPNNIKITENKLVKNENNYFLYQETIYASYVMTYINMGKWNMNAGCRLENTQIKGTLSLMDTSFYRNYVNLFPSANITYNKNPKVSYTFMYSRKIDRPKGDQLNPVLQITDPFSAQRGDPYLVPSFSDNTELTSSLLGGVLITGINYSYVYKPIVWAYRLNKSDNRFINGQTNLKFQKSYGVSVSVNKPIYKWWQSSNNLNIINNQFVGVTDFGEIDNKMTGWVLNSTQSFKLPNDFNFETSGMYQSPTSYAFAKSFSRWQVNFALQKKILYKRGMIKVAVNDLFWKFQFGGSNEMGTTIQKSNYKWDNRTVMLTFTYRFGNQLMKE